MGGPTRPLLCTARPASGVFGSPGVDFAVATVTRSATDRLPVARSGNSRYGVRLDRVGNGYTRLVQNTCKREVSLRYPKWAEMATKEEQLMIAEVSRARQTRWTRSVCGEGAS